MSNEHNHRGSELEYRNGLPVGYRVDGCASETLPSPQPLTYPDIAIAIGLSSDPDPKTVKREALGFMDLRRAREQVFSVTDREGIIGFVDLIGSSGSQVIFVRVDHLGGGHRPQPFNTADIPTADIPTEGSIRIMEQASGGERRPFRITLFPRNRRDFDAVIEYGCADRKADQTFEKYKQGITPVEEKNEFVSINFEMRSGLNQILARKLPNKDFDPEARQQFASSIVNACSGMQILSNRLIRDKDHPPTNIGVEGYVDASGNCIFVDTDFPSADLPRWVQKKR